MRVAGLRAQMAQDAQPELHVDYADVLKQAVDNARWKVLRDVRAALDRIPTTNRDYDRYSSSDVSASTFKQNAVKALEGLERE